MKKQISNTDFDTEDIPILYTVPPSTEPQEQADWLSSLSNFRTF